MDSYQDLACKCGKIDKNGFAKFFVFAKIFVKNVDIAAVHVSVYSMTMPTWCQRSQRVYADTVSA